MSDELDLNLIARQLRQLITDVAAVRDDMAVLTAIMLRQDATLTALLTEVRSIHSQHARLGSRVRSIEERVVPT